MPTYFNDPAKIEALAEKIVPALPPSASAEQQSAREDAVQGVKDYLTELTTYVKSELNAVFTLGVPVPNDGGATLQTTWKTATTDV